MCSSYWRRMMMRNIGHMTCSVSSGSCSLRMGRCSGRKLPGCTSPLYDLWLT
ncbi:hypothetical protein MAR_035856 [Mya arenaria]|uniref:Uncharacterized protein n=1 Tax=Mya arenaria TaxID=6604 RepID=A0ABY7ENI8_MYAAR|nr:hypothetical protein MAR_035856 [Mya arenaria]